MFDSVIPLLGILVEVQKAKNVLSNIFIKAKKKKQYIFPSISEWLNKLWYINTMKYIEFNKVGRPVCSDITGSLRYMVKWKRNHKIICIIWTSLCQGKTGTLRCMTECVCLHNCTKKCSGDTKLLKVCLLHSTNL